MMLVHVIHYQVVVKAKSRIIVKFVILDTKHQMIKNKRILKNNNIFVHDDLTQIRVKKTTVMRQNVENFCTVNDKIVVFMRDKEKIVFENLHKSQKWDNELFSYIRM